MWPSRAIEGVDMENLLLRGTASLARGFFDQRSGRSLCGEIRPWCACSDHAVAQYADAFGLHLDHVARREPFVARVGTERDHIASFHDRIVRAIAQHFERIKDHIGGTARASHLAINPDLNLQVAGVWKFPAGNYPRAHRAKARKILRVAVGLSHLKPLALPVAGGDVVANRVTENVVACL